MLNRNHELRSILIVDDDPSHAAMIARSLRSGLRELELHTAASLAEARATLQALGIPDLVIADLSLPDGRGVELLDGHSSHDGIPLLVVTSHGDEQSAVEAIKAGAIDYVVKSEASIQALPQIARRASREWHDILARRRAENALRVIREGVDPVTGSEFFQSLVRHLACELDCRCALIGTVFDDGDGRNKIRTLAWWLADGPGEDFEFYPDGMPCEDVLEGRVRVYPRNLRSLFPDYTWLHEAQLESYVGAPLLDKQGRAIGVIVVLDTKPLEHPSLMKDILGIFASRVSAEIQRQQTEEKLRLQDQSFRTLVENIPGVVVRCETQPPFKILQISEGVLDLCGQPAEAFRSGRLRFADIVVSEDLDLLRQKTLDGVRDGRPYEIIFRVRHVDGSVRWIHHKARVCVDSDGRPVYIDGVGLDITARRLAEEESAKSRAFLEAAMEACPAPILVAEAPDVRIKYVNSAGLRLRGGSRESLADIPAHLHHERWQTYHPDGTPYDGIDMPLSRAALKGETVQNEELVIRDSHGKMRWVLANSAPVRDETGDIVAGVVFFPDITEQREASEALRDSEAKLNAILSNIPDLAWLRDREGYLVAVNEPYARAIGLRAEECLGKTDLDLWPPTAAEGFKERARRVVETGHEDRTEELIPTADGERWMETVRRPVFDTHGQVMGTVGIARDITDSRNIREALRLSEKKYRTLFDGIVDGVFIVDGNSRILEANQCACTQLGYTHEELLEMNSEELSARSHSDAGAISAAGTSQETVTYETVYRRRNGAPFNVEVSVSPIDYGGTKAYMAVTRDITERKKAEEALLYLSFHDALTGLYNRAFFAEELKRLQTGWEFPISIVSTDIDGLKLVNDTMGHVGGDQLLTTYARILRSCFRATDVIARVGGDEFAIVLPGSNRATAEHICRRLDTAVESHNSHHPSLPLSVSWGIHTAHKKEDSLEDAFRLADLEMYKEKLQIAASGRHALIDTLLAALAIKDNNSEGHTQRVRDLAARMADAIGLSKRERADLALLAMMHDLGKVGIPDRILFKHGPLTADEWEEMKRHPVMGYRIARSSPDLAHVADLILHHHEWWDGNGYPSGLTGEDIPLLCRILSIVDAFDSMTNARPYRNAVAPEEAMKEIRAEIGTKFDPQLVKLFARVVGCYSAGDDGSDKQES